MLWSCSCSTAIMVRPSYERMPTTSQATSDCITPNRSGHHPQPTTHYLSHTSYHCPCSLAPRLSSDRNGARHNPIRPFETEPEASPLLAPAPGSTRAAIVGVISRTGRPGMGLITTGFGPCSVRLLRPHGRTHRPRPSTPRWIECSAARRNLR